MLLRATLTPFEVTTMEEKQGEETDSVKEAHYVPYGEEKEDVALLQLLL